MITAIARQPELKDALVSVFTDSLGGIVDINHYTVDFNNDGFTCWDCSYESLQKK